MPERFDQLLRKQPTWKVSKLKELFKILLELIQYKYVVTELKYFIEEIQEEVWPEKRVNHIGKRLKTGRELRMTSQIGDYDMDYIYLELGYDVNIMTR